VRRQADARSWSGTLTTLWTWRSAENGFLQASKINILNATERRGCSQWSTIMPTSCITAMWTCCNRARVSVCACFLQLPTHSLPTSLVAL
uniref:Uncharacterized protein n=1 Tax=Mus spicilegus TaxID=10103 RepID=A0A8C6HHW2_MUSSI